MGFGGFVYSSRIFSRNLLCHHVLPKVKFSSTSKPIEVQIPVPWGHIAGKWWGSQDKRPVLAVHGWLDNAASFDKLVPLLSPEISVLAIDLPGHGHSSHLAPGLYYHSVDYAIVLRRVAQHFGWAKTSLMGHSLGGGICFLYSSLYPKEVDGLVLLDGFIPIPIHEQKLIDKGGEIIDKFIERMSLLPENAPSYTLKDLINRSVKANRGSLTNEGAEILLRRGTVQRENGKYSLLRDVRLKDMRLSGWSLLEIIEFCTAIKTNVLCFKAEHSNYYTSKEVYYSCWELVKQNASVADRILVPGHHHVHLENAPEVAESVNLFLQQYCGKD